MLCPITWSAYSSRQSSVPSSQNFPQKKVLGHSIHPTIFSIYLMLLFDVLVCFNVDRSMDGWIDLSIHLLSLPELAISTKINDTDATKVQDPELAIILAPGVSSLLVWDDAPRSCRLGGIGSSVRSLSSCSHYRRGQQLAFCVCSVPKSFFFRRKRLREVNNSLLHATFVKTWWSIEYLIFVGLHLHKIPWLVESLYDVLFPDAAKVPALAWDKSERFFRGNGPWYFASGIADGTTDRWMEYNSYEKPKRFPKQRTQYRHSGSSVL